MHLIAVRLFPVCESACCLPVVVHEARGRFLLSLTPRTQFNSTLEMDPRHTYNFYGASQMASRHDTADLSAKVEREAQAETVMDRE
ncbi:hypothetical protein B0H14DRAFT_3433776 [Mycena olivaceomarginata]|nr:hypothetical protein B0H14DRAFT_3433776 [Mycena olivaceomarginata]